MKKGERRIPDGKCWCGCGEDAKIGKFFKSGHDRVAETAVVKVEYGNVVEFLVAHGYGSILRTKIRIKDNVISSTKSLKCCPACNYPYWDKPKWKGVKK